jgi:hypothetical protein
MMFLKIGNVLGFLAETDNNMQRPTLSRIKNGGIPIGIPPKT